MSNKRKRILPHEKSSNDFQKTTDLLIKDLLREHGLPPTFIETNAFREFIRHLNPLATFSLIEHQEPQNVCSLKDFLPATNSQFSADANKIRQPLPTSLRLDPPCIICLAPTATTKGILLNLNETAKILMAAVLTKSVKIENAAQSICNHPLRMCSSHARPVYEMMVKAIGARTADDVDRIRVDRMMPGLELYKVLRSIRTTIEKKPIAMTQMGSFKMALKKFYKIYTPKEVKDAIMKETNRVNHMNSILQKNPSDLHVRRHLANQSIQIQAGEEMNVLDAIKLPEHPHFVQPNITQGISGTPVQEQDLLYNTITERRTNYRQKRYDTYPEEIRKMMEPIDALYDKQTAECRTQMKSIRNQKTAVTGPNKRGAREVIVPGTRKRQPPTRYQDLVAQKLKEAAEQQALVDKSAGPGTNDNNEHLTTIRGTPSYSNLAQEANNTVEKKPEGLGGLMQEHPLSEKKPEGLGNLMQKQPPLEKKPEGLGNLMQEQPLSEKKPQLGDLLIPKEEPIDFGDEIYNQLMALQEQEKRRQDNRLVNPAFNHATYNAHEECEEVDMYSLNSPQKVVSSGDKYR